MAEYDYNEFHFLPRRVWHMDALDLRQEMEYDFFSYVTEVDTPSSPPQAENPVPTPGSNVTPGAVLSYDVVDDQGLFVLNIVALYSAGNRTEIIHDGLSFQPGYGTSTRTPITGGFHYELRRDGGWPTNPDLSPLPLTIRHWSIDPQGGINA